MKTLLYFRLFLSVIFSLLLIQFFSNYGNKAVHPDLNAMILGAFLKQNSTPTQAEPFFKNYTFLFLSGTTLKGTAVIKDGYFSPNDIAAAGLGYGYSEEGPAEKTVKGWITHGGYSADVPEVPASLRHFYDPTKPAGNRYLTDIANSKIMGSLQKYVLTNPKTDAVEWAMGKPGIEALSVQDHFYTWERGKNWIRMALNEQNKKKQNEYMANAWRSLGETLHMIADNGCPPHVRNDAHPSPFLNNNTFLGNPDPYEEFMDQLKQEKPDVFAQFGKGTPDPDFRNKINSLKTGKEIAHEMAYFTNKNFVTNETISGIDKNGKKIQQLIHPESPYSSPLLQQMKYYESDHTYRTSSGVKQCADVVYFSDLIPRISEPTVTMECVISQAKALIPNIIVAGKNMIKLFIPKLKVEIQSAENTTVKGMVKHMRDPEYATEIMYNGPVKLVLKDKNFKIKKEIEITAKDGVFETSEFALGSSGNKVTAIIEFGGILINSDPFNCTVVSNTPVIKSVAGGSTIDMLIYVNGTFDKDFRCGAYNKPAVTWIDIENNGIPVNKGLGEFKGTKKWGVDIVEVSGIISEEKIIELRYRGTYTDDERQQQWDITVKDIPLLDPDQKGKHGQITYQLRPYEMGLEKKVVNMYEHLTNITVKEVCIKNKQFSRNLSWTDWDRKFAGTTVASSPLMQQSAIQIRVNR